MLIRPLVNVQVPSVLKVPVVIIPVVAYIVTRRDKLEDLHAITRPRFASDADRHDRALKAHHSQAISKTTLVELLIGNTDTAGIDIFLIAGAKTSAEAIAKAGRTKFLKFFISFLLYLIR